MKRLNSKDLRKSRLASRFVHTFTKEWNIANNDKKRRHEHMRHKSAAKLRFKEFQEIHKKRGVFGL